jgi:predicted acyltransferase
MRRQAATVSVLAGYWAGRAVRREGWRLAIVGVAAISAGALWGHAVPINKRLWTPSYVVLMAGISLCALAVLHELLDRRLLVARAAALPWRVLGTNALAVYVGTELSAAALGAYQQRLGGQHVAVSVWVWGAWRRPHFGARPATLVFGSLLLAIWWLVAAALYRCRVFIRA